MKFTVIHRARGQLRLDLPHRRLSGEDADTLYYALLDRPGVRSAHILWRTGQILLRYDPDREGTERELLAFLRGADPADPELKKAVPAVSGRATNEEFREKIGTEIIRRYAKRFLLPAPIRTVWTVCNGLPFIRAGIRDLLDRKFSAEIVHASAILASLLTGTSPPPAPSSS